MISVAGFEEKAIAAIGQVRKQTLLRGEPFLVYDANLPEGQYYLEYPDGDIFIVSVSREKNDFIVQDELDAIEINNLRRKHQLPAVF